MAIGISQRIERGIRDLVINAGLGQKYMALNKAPELKQAFEAFENSKEKFLQNATPEQRKNYVKLEGEVEEQMSTAGLAHAGTLLNNLSKMRDIIHKANKDNPNMEGGLKKLDQEYKKASELLTNALALTPEERQGAMASYANDQLKGGSEVTLSLTDYINNKRKPGEDLSFYSAKGHNASISHSSNEKGNFVSVNVRSILHPEEAAIDMARLLGTQGFKKGEFNDDGTFKKDAKGNDIKGDKVTIDGLDKLEEAEKKMMDKFKDYSEAIKQGPFAVLAQIILNLVEYGMFQHQKNTLEKQALACYARGYEVDGVENMSKGFRDKLKEARVDYLKSEEREQQNVRELANEGLVKQVEFGPMTEKQSQRQDAQDKYKKPVSTDKKPNTSSAEDADPNLNNQPTISPGSPGFGSSH